MKNKLDIFEKAKDLLDEPEVQELLDYCDGLEDQIIDMKFDKDKNKEHILLDMLREVIKGCNELEREKYEHERFGFEKPDYEDKINNLKDYILDMCKANRIWL
jgi:hypothetical protein